MVIGPCHPFQRRLLQRLTGLPGRSAVYQLSLVLAVDRLGQSVVVQPVIEWEVV